MPRSLGSTMSAAIPSPAQLQETFGVLFTGYGLSVIAYGFTFFQTYLHFSNAANTSVGVKTLVFTLLTYFYFVTSLPYLGGLVHIVPKFTIRIADILSCLIAIGEHSLFCFRLEVNSLKAISIFAVHAPTPWSLPSGADLCCGNAAEYDLLPRRATAAKVVISLSQTFQFLAALAIFGALTAYGRGEPSKTRSSRSILFPHRMHGEPKTKLRDDIVAHFISHGFLGAGFQFAGLLAFVARPHKIAWIPFHFLATKFAINGLLYFLNLQSKSTTQSEETSFVSSGFRTRRPHVSRTIEISHDMTSTDDLEFAKGGYAVHTQRSLNQTDTFHDVIATQKQEMNPGANVDAE
ncbi:hypothetical protein B0H14DRAFT_2575961 [Mycena olivaceomarginata]|nr:hypothetical protein B0H14DRAFT_2575961 [Mycena olivaceomarginata]